MRTAICATLLSFLTLSAYATNNRSAVSVNGSDLNSCAINSPCRSFSAALAATADGGEVIALDSAGYGPFTVNQSVTVSGAPGVHAAITVSSGDGIVVAAGDVTLRNLVIIGTPTADNGIRNAGAQTLHVINVLIGGFVIANGEGRGIISSSGILYLDNVRLHKNAFGAAVLGGSLRIVDSTIDDSTEGIVISGNVHAHIVNTAVSGNGNGIDVSAPLAGNVADTTLDHCTISLNGLGLLVENGAGSPIARLTNNAFFFNNPFDIQGSASGTIYTFGNNSIQNLGSATLTPVALH
jgi:hypothetical protein